MALPEHKADRLRCFQNALGNWRYAGFVNFRKRVEEWLRGQLGGYSLADVRRLLHEFVVAGGQIDEQVESRPEFVSYECHYDLRIPFGNRVVYFESVLLCNDASDPDDPIIQVVSVHDA